MPEIRIFAQNIVVEISSVHVVPKGDAGSFVPLQDSGVDLLLTVVVGGGVSSRANLWCLHRVFLSQ